MPSSSTDRLTGPFKPSDSWYLQRLNQMYWSLQDVQRGVGVPVPRQWDFDSVAGAHALGAGLFVGDPSVFVDGLLLRREFWVFDAWSGVLTVTFIAPHSKLSIVGVWRPS